MLKKSVAALLLCLGLVCCAAPAGVPRGANVEFNPVAGPSGLEWSWQRRVEHGCVDFTAADLDLPELSLSVRLSVDPARCGGPERTFVRCTPCGPGFLYIGDNYMFFQNYYSWTTEHSHLGSSLSPEQLAALRIVASEALAEATTDLERRTVEHIDQILAATDGAALITAQHGCAPDAEREPFPTEE